MGPLLDRKKRISLAVEFLEDRQLLSHPGSSMGWDFPALEAASRPESPAPIWGPMVASGDQADRAMPGSPSAEGPAGPSARGFEGPSAPTGSTVNCATALSTVTSEAFGGPQGPGPDRPSGEGPGPAAGNLPTGGGPSSPPPPADAPESQKVAAADLGGAPASGDDHASPRASSPSFAAQAANNPPIRNGSPGPILNPGPGFVQTARVETVEVLPVPSTVALATPVAALNVLAIGATPVEVINGAGSAGGPPRVAPEDGTTRGFAVARPSGDASLGPDWEARETGVESGLTEVAVARPSERFEAPDPQAADMITSLLPFDRSTLEAAIDQLLDPLDGLASSVPGLRGPMGLVTASLAVAVTVLAVDVAIRLRRSRVDEVELDGAGGLVAFPGLPGTRRWSRP